MDPRYSPPDSRIAEPIGPGRGIRPGAIALGTLVDIGGTLLFGVAWSS